MRRIIATTALLVAVLAVAACSSTPDSVESDQRNINSQLNRYQANQPVPQFDWSQYRQTAIDVETAQVHGIATTTFFFNLGVQQPVKVCPSIGFPMPTTAQLTNPDQPLWGANGAANVIAQQEPNGVYTGDSTGTYTVCVASKGVRYVSYWEGFVQTEGGPAHWDGKTNMIVLDGVTVRSSTRK